MSGCAQSRAGALGASAVWLLIAYNRFTSPSNMIVPALSAISPLIMLSIISGALPRSVQKYGAGASGGGVLSKRYFALKEGVASTFKV